METLHDRIVRHEGLRLKPYKDSLGYLTIGVGRCLDTNGITKDEAFYMLDNDISRVKREVAKEFPWIIGLDETRQEVLYEMCFQLGINRMSLFKRMIAALRDGRYDDAAEEMLDSGWHKQTPKRCEEMALIMKRGF